MHRLTAIRSLSFRLDGLHLSARMRSPIPLDVLPLVALEIHVLLASSSRSGLQSPFPARLICCSTFRLLECLTSFADERDLLHPLLTLPAVRLPLGSLSRRSDTGQISRVIPAAFRAQSPNLRFAFLDGLWTSQYVARSSDAHALYSVLVIDSHICLTLPSDLLAVIALASSLPFTSIRLG